MDHALEQSWEQVRRLAEQYDDEWEGQDLAGDSPLQLFTAGSVPRRVLIVTKEAVASRLPRYWSSGFVAVVKSGVFTSAQAAVLDQLASDELLPIPFIGDADPMGLHTYLSLKSQLGGSRVRFCGICDSVLDMIGEDDAQPEKLESLALSLFDRAHLQVVEALAAPEEVLGSRVARILRNGRKIELESLSFRAELMIPALFNAALRLAHRTT